MFFKEKGGILRPWGLEFWGLLGLSLRSALSCWLHAVTKGFNLIIEKKKGHVV